MIKCECSERIGSVINSYQLYEEIKMFFEELAQATLLCPADIQLQNSTRDGKEIVVGEGSSISVKHIEDTEGNKFLMAFKTMSFDVTK